VTTPVFVPDASVILKWVLSSPAEPERDRALHLRDQWLAGRVRLVVPGLWSYEVGNTVGRREPRLAAELMATLLALEMEELPVVAWYRRALGLVRRHAVSFYDASYHAVALEVGGALVTADAAYVRKAGSAGAVVPIGRLELGWTAAPS